MSPTRMYIGVLHRDGPPSPIDLAHDTGTNAGTHGLVNVAMDVELGMHHGESSTRKRTCMIGVSRVLTRNGPLEPWRRCIRFR